MPGLLDNNNRSILVNKHLVKTVYNLGSIVCHEVLGSGSRTRNKQPEVSIPADCVPWNLSTGSGHYFIYEKNDSNSNSWTLFNDRKVTKFELADAMLKANDSAARKNTYMLLYY